MFSNRKTMFLSGALAFLVVARLQAQTPEAPPAPAPAAVPEVKPDLEALQAAARDAEAKLPSPKVEPQTYFDLAPVQRERWQQFLPQTLLKLTRREPVQIVVLGDAILDGVAASSGEDPLLGSFVGVFAKALANQFYYTGGVRALPPGAGSAGSGNMGPEILLQPLRTRSIVSAAAALATAGFQGRPDLVLVAHGTEDAVAGTRPLDIVRALSSLLEVARAQHLEIIVAAPLPQAAAPEERSLALTGGASSVMREFCEREKLLFSDLGDLSRLVSLPTEVSEAHLLFPALVLQYQSRLQSSKGSAPAVPTSETHATLGRMLFEDVMNGEPAMPWAILDTHATLAGKGSLKLDFQLVNQSKAKLSMVVLPLPPPGLTLKDNAPELTLEAGQKQKVSVTYTITDTLRLPLSDGEMRLPVLVMAGRVSRILELAVPLQPFSVAWNARAAFNLETTFRPDLEIENSSGGKLEAAWESGWAGQKKEGKVTLDANGAETLDLALPLPTDAKTPFRQRLPLNFAVTSGGVRQIFDRYVEIVRNFGLKEAVPLAAADGQESAATLRADADGMKLFLTLDLAGVDLVDDDSGVGYELLLNLDARSYGDRLTSGATSALRFTGRAGDGTAVLDPIVPWAFGSGYAAEYDVSEFRAVLSSSAAGRRRLTITLPRTYLYKHEWALGNGNSQLGINVRFSGGGREYFLTRSSRQGDDAESLGVLELTEKPTRRWTVRVE